MYARMTSPELSTSADKQVLISEIRKRNRSATREFLSAFNTAELAQYLNSLKQIDPEPAFAARGAREMSLS
jgi:hypothetical protein